MYSLKTAPAKKILTDYNSKPTAYWMALQKKTVEQIYKLTGQVKAYQKFLKLQGIDQKKIKKYSDIAALPPINKPNYFRKFGLQDVALAGSYQKSPLVMTATSGSTGQPTYFPRTEQIDWQYSILAEFFLNNGGAGSTLLIDCFGMGVWIGGLITYQAFHDTALRGYPVTVITPGINKKEIFHALRELAPQFKNVIVAGYPPFVKDIVDESAGEKINFNKFRLRLLFAAESFTETFRDYVCRAGKIKNAYFDTLNIYGSAELGAMAFETPGSIFIRKLALKHERIFKNLFSRGGSPTLAQYNPAFTLFEEHEGRILISGQGPVPFLRYDIGDTGGTYTLETITTIFKEHGVDLLKEARSRGVNLLKLPFVYVHERADFSTTLYGLQIYPQTIKRAIETPRLLRFITGKFNLETSYDKKSNQFLQVNIELKKNVKTNSKLHSQSLEKIISHLLKENMEYRELSKMLSHERVRPRLVFWPYESKEHFMSGAKHKWVKK